MRRFMHTALLATTLLGASASGALAASDALPPKQVPWPFEGIDGKVDERAAQRGLQVYKEVCASCHGLKRVAFRNLQDIGFSEAEVKALAAEYTIIDGPNDEGDMFERPGKPSDRFVPPFPNQQAARAANNGAYPPDLSLIVKARPDGANYLYSLLTGYQEPPADVTLPTGMYYNPYFPGAKLAMPNPMFEGQVEYQDGTPATVDQMSRDLVQFLQWTAEPETEDRKRMGIRVLIYLALMTLLFIIAKKRVWKSVK